MGRLPCPWQSTQPLLPSDLPPSLLPSFLPSASFPLPFLSYLTSLLYSLPHFPPPPLILLYSTPSPLVSTLAEKYDALAEEMDDSVNGDLKSMYRAPSNTQHDGGEASDGRLRPSSRVGGKREF